jgi:hypothetical protein
VPSQRGFEQVSQPELSELSMPNQNSRMQIPASPFGGYAASPLSGPSVPQSSPQPQSSAQPSYSPDQPQVQLPKIGETRCYWSLLSADLHFIYLDPVLALHLEEQADALVGKSLLSFVHPDEQSSAGRDLGDVLESRTSHGSVTRVRYCRLSRVRRMLGHQGAGVPWTDAEKIALDSNYMAVDVVINWAAEGLVLCFIHAAVDLTPHDNDEHRKTGWTNWCGTPYMSMDQIQLVYQRLLVCVPQTGTMSRVFQILSNQQEKTLLMTWPPDQGQGQGPTGRDFAKSVVNVQIGTGVQAGNDAKTSCTRRYRSQQNMPSVLGEVESIFIPHGTIIFACHKLNAPPRSTSAGSSSMQHMGYGNSTYVAPNQSYYEQSSSYSLPPVPSTSPSYGNYFPQQSTQPATQYSPEHWTQTEGTSPSQQYNSWNSPSPSHSVSPLPASVSNIRSGSYPPTPQNQQWSSQPQSYVDNDSPVAQSFPRPLTPSYEYSPRGDSEGTSPPADVVPPPRRRVSPGTTRDQYPSGGRTSGSRPMGVLKCSSCKATQSPEWRKGPSGKKELCNACGLRYARSRAKKEGTNLTQRRRKDKGLALVKRESATPPVSSSAPSYSALRRHYNDGSFMSTSPTGSVSGNEIYPPSGHPGLDSLTPSPSPPASSVNFVHYAPHSQSQHGDARQTYPNASSSFYSVPSPLSNPPVLQSQHGNHSSIPRLDHISTYSDRHSPTHSPLTSTVPPASYERERNRDRELPPTPVSASPRHPRRSILSQQ